MVPRALHEGASHDGRVDLLVEPGRQSRLRAAPCQRPVSDQFHGTLVSRWLDPGETEALITALVKPMPGNRPEANFAADQHQSTNSSFLAVVKGGRWTRLTDPLLLARPRLVRSVR